MYKEGLGSVKAANAADLARRVSELETALGSRVTIEQAKGILAERFGLSIDDAFELLRQSARSRRDRITTVAEEIVTGGECTPDIVVATLAKLQQHSVFSAGRPVLRTAG